MNLRVLPGRLSGEITAPPSKSLAHRRLICSALSDNASRIELSSVCDDVQATIDCLTALGADIRLEAGEAKIHPAEKFCEGTVLECRGSGTTLRFLLPIAAALNTLSRFTASEELLLRPISELLEALAEHGAEPSECKLPMELGGSLKAGCYELPGNVSSQFVSGLLLSLPLLSGDSEIVLSSPLQSAPYAAMTAAVMSEYGVSAEKTPEGWLVRGNQHYHAPETALIEGDWSAAAAALTAGAINRRVKVADVFESSYQGDRRIVEYLRRFGAELTVDNNGITASKARLRPCCIDVSDTPDLFPVLCVAASAAQGESRFVGISRLRYKESDRILSVTDMINALGGSAVVEDDCVLIRGTRLKGGRVDCRDDHRIAMAAAVAASICADGAELIGADCVSKSYPDFWHDFAALGGKTETISR